MHQYPQVPTASRTAPTHQKNGEIRNLIIKECEAESQKEDGGNCENHPRFPLRED